MVGPMITRWKLKGISISEQTMIWQTLVSGAWMDNDKTPFTVLILLLSNINRLDP
jgi:hypothetical protein